MNTAKIEPKTEIGKELWEFLQENPMNISDLACMIGVSGHTITRVLSYPVEPNLKVRLQIQKFLKENR